MKLLKDIPLLEDGTEDRTDSLGFGAYARTMTDAILGTEGLFAIGILAEWGGGADRAAVRDLAQRLKGDGLRGVAKKDDSE